MMTYFQARNEGAGPHTEHSTHTLTPHTHTHTHTLTVPARPIARSYENRDFSLTKQVPKSAVSKIHVLYTQNRGKYFS